MKTSLAAKRLIPCGLVVMLLVPTFVCGAEPERSALPEPFSPDRLLWELELGSHQYTVPRIDDGQIFMGINDLAIDHPAIKSSGGGILMCREAATGKLIWQLPIPRNMEGTDPPSHFGHWKCGVCSQPAIDGDRLFMVGLRGDVLCIDRNGQADGNDGPFLDDARYMGVPEASNYKLSKLDGDIVWRLDMIEQLGVV
ncbi:MAG TPA: hypothetical protein VE890_06790, partial [Thermoguttaceae bacterium]|nr:hypothetical protein [Thermoguttaceae bacterium]